jgi:hypothetical protein
MVNYLYEYFHQDIFLETLSQVSDTICEDNEKKYINFDIFKKPHNCANVTKGMNSLSSVDSLLINKDKNHIVFVEFKDMNDLENIEKWFKEKECSIKIKIPDSILLLGYFVQKNGYSFDDFMNIKKSFIYLYKNVSAKRKINNHLKYKFNKYNFMLRNTYIIESQAYRNKFLEETP